MEAFIFLSHYAILGVVNALIIFGLYNASTGEYLLSGLDRRLSILPDFVYDPLIGCMVCMSSFWGSVLWFFGGFLIVDSCFVWSLVAYPFYILYLSGILGGISLLYEQAMTSLSHDDNENIFQ